MTAFGFLAGQKEDPLCPSRNQSLRRVLLIARRKLDGKANND